MASTLVPNSSRTVVGGKARSLVQLEAAGFPVPEFQCDPVDLDTVVARLGFPLVVRSSATVEDGGETSFAGQFKSFLDLRSTEEVAEAIGKCRQSLHGLEVREYCRRNGVDVAELEMGVIVQRMIEPELAGVAFTVNPVTGAEEIVIEAVAGRADDLLAGRVRTLPRNDPRLMAYGEAIEQMARAIQRHFGRPQDIEFAVEAGTLYVLQARPITRIGFSPEIGEWTNADFRDGGVSCRVCTPLMWSLYDFIWERTLKGFLAEIKLFQRDFVAGRMFFGRPYWNLGEVKRCLSVLPGFSEADFERDLGIVSTEGARSARTPMTLHSLWRALPTAWAVTRIWKRQQQFNRGFLEGGFEKMLRDYREIPQEPGAKFRELIEHAYWITESNYFRTIYCASLAKLDFSEAFPEADYAALASGLPRLSHLEPTAALRTMIEQGENDLEPFLEKFAHRSRHELDIREPRWDEDRPWVEELFESTRRHLEAEPVSAANASSDLPRQQFEEARAKTLRQLPWHKRRSFERKLERLRNFIWSREQMRDLSSRMYHLIRRYLLALAEKHGWGDDVFFMTYEEILRGDRSNVDRARERYEGFRDFKAPNEIGCRYRFEKRSWPQDLRGLGASRGQVEGIARVARSIEEAARIEQGAILICPFTDPGWTPVLDRVAGVVTETGGLLSHAAVICREYGIPAVLSLNDATERIPDGARVRVDGGDGQVELLV